MANFDFGFGAAPIRCDIGSTYPGQTDTLRVKHKLELGENTRQDRRKQ
jgi:hypothetical protein